jgi:hypothetical protein
LSRDQHSILNGTVTLALNAAFDKSNPTRWASVVHSVYPSGHTNENPSVVLAVAEWIAETMQILTAHDNYFDLWLRPTVGTQAVTDSQCVLTLIIIGPVDVQLALKEDLVSRLPELFGHTLSEFPQMTMRDVFDAGGSSLVLTVA